MRHVVVEKMVVSWLKYEYGVFDENGTPGDSMYPAFHRFYDAVRATSCSNVPVTGNFTKTCLNDSFDDAHCLPDKNQVDVTSSLLFSTKNEFFPNVSAYYVISYQL